MRNLAFAAAGGIAAAVLHQANPNAASVFTDTLTGSLYGIAAYLDRVSGTTEGGVLFIALCVAVAVFAWPRGR